VFDTTSYNRFAPVQQEITLISPPEISAGCSPVKIPMVTACSAL